MLHCEEGIEKAKVDCKGVRHLMDGLCNCLHYYVPQGILLAGNGGGEVRALNFPGPIMTSLETGSAHVRSHVRRKVPGDVVGAPVKVGSARFRATQDSKGYEHRVVRGRDSLAPKGLMVLPHSSPEVTEMFFP